MLEEIRERVTVALEGRQVWIRAWKYTVKGEGGDTVPVYLLDTDLPENSAWDRTLTESLYGGDERYRLCQEVILGSGGFLMLRKLGHTDLQAYHMNEGHSALLALSLLERRLDQSFAGRVKELDVVGIRRMCIFTTHTPVPAGHDRFSRELAVQFARQGVRVNALCPGPVETPLLTRLFTEDPAAYERRRVHLPMGRLARPREVTNAALFLASDESSYVNGATFLVDGGLTAAYVTPE